MGANGNALRSFRTLRILRSLRVLRVLKVGRRGLSRERPAVCVGVWAALPPVV